MAYCSSTELTLLTGTTLSTTIQDAIIGQSDRLIQTRIYAAHLTPPTSNDMLKGASLDLSKIGIITHNRMTGTQTKSVKVGDITVADDLDMQIKALTGAAWAAVDAYITYTKGGVSIPTMAVVGRQGQRIGEHEEMTDAEEDVY